MSRRTRHVALKCDVDEHASTTVATGAPTADAVVNTFLTEAVSAFDRALPDMVRAYYVIGSYADGSAVALSDLDLVVLCKGRLENPARTAAWRVGDALERSCPIRLDLTISGEDDQTWEKVHVKRASRLVHGEDVRDHISLRPARPPRPPRRLDATGHALPNQRSMRYAARTLRELRGVTRLRYPLHYPDPAGEFFGYDVIRHEEWYPPGTTGGLRELVNAAALMAGALTPPDPESGAASRAQAITLYRERVGGEWAEFVEALYRSAKLRWGYLVPEDASERTDLRRLCQRMLGFENDFLRRWREATHAP